MYAQLTYFDGPRGAELLAAADFAARERIEPVARSVPGTIRTYVLRKSDGAEIVLTIAESKQALADVQTAIMGTHLLPGEDAALLPGADRVEVYPVLTVVEHTGARS